MALRVSASRAAICGILLLAVGACTSDPNTNRQIAKALPFTREAPSAAPAFVAAALTNAPRYIGAVETRPEAIALFVRQAISDSSGVSTWIGPDGSQLIFSDGMLVGTRGFGSDVMASDVSQSRALVQNLAGGFSTRLMTLINGEDRAVTRAFRCRVTPGDLDPVMIGNRKINARTVTEECRGEVTSFRNYYWVVPGSGEIIQSSQWAGETAGKISLRIAPGKAG